MIELFPSLELIVGSFWFRFLFGRRVAEELEEFVQRSENADELFRELRGHWFRSNVALKAPERVWEREDQETEREEYNSGMRKQFDEQTERLLAGQDGFLIAPRCGNDLNRDVCYGA